MAIGQLFITASTLVNTVRSSSQCSTCSPNVLWSKIFILRTAASQSPPKCRARPGEKCHLIVLVDAHWMRAALDRSCANWYIFFSSACAPINLEPLSENTSARIPLRAVNRSRVARKAFEVSSMTISRCTALVAKQIKTAT